MAKMWMPYQCLEKCGNFLVAARGSNIDLFRLSDGSSLSTWKCPSSQEPQEVEPAAQEVKPKLQNEDSKSSSVDIIVEASAPPAKRRKLSEEEAQDEHSANGQKEDNKAGNKKNKKDKKQNNRLESVANGLGAPAIIALAVTSDSVHVIAITGEDKSIRVFSIISQDGIARLQQLSRRAMPKRPSALAITDGNTTILSADKFGDVYSLPLLPSPDGRPIVATSPLKEQEEKPFKPLANELTIHSQRNRKALANQKRQQKAQSQKTVVEFEHTLLLGHVSLLTDIKLATSGSRTYVVTADRDEHIRISRGIPQTHVIEGFCFGHEEFVSRLCIPESRPEIMISGGGDAELYVWEWEKSLLVSKTQLKAKVEEFVGEKLAKIAVSGIWHTRQAGRDIVLVTVQGLPALFTFNLTESNKLESDQILGLSGNALSVLPEAPTPEQILISVDDVHKPGSIAELRESNDEATSPFQTFVFQKGVLVQHSFGLVTVEDNEVPAEAVNGLRNLLYSLENLRKRDGEERGGGDGDDGDAAMVDEAQQGEE